MILAAVAPGNVTLSVLNPALREPTVYVNTTATLNVVLENDTGSDITLSSGSTPSTLAIYMPSYYTAAQVSSMTISLAGWTLSYPPDALQLTFSGTDRTAWKAGTAIAFPIENAKSTAQPTTDLVQVNPANMTGGSVPSMLTATLSLVDPPQPGNPKLADVLQLSLEDQGTVYVSQTGDPLQNKLFLNVKNLGSDALYVGETMWTGTPQATVSFVYGTTPGSLAPDNDKSHPGAGSAWTINSGVDSMPPNDPWYTTDPSTTGEAVHPRWVLAPSSTNQQIIGTGDAANVTFKFSNVVSFTQPGHTQMVVQFTGFMRDEKTPYDGAVFVLDIVKLRPPPTRGLVNFAGQQPIYEIFDRTTPMSVTLKWTMFDVASANLLTGVPGTAVQKVTYPNPQPLAQDSITVSVLPPVQSSPVTFTLQAFDGNAAYLNSLQYTIFVQSWIYVDPRDGKTYPTILVGNTFWLAANFDYDAGSGSMFYNNNPINEATFGRLYTTSTAAAAVPPGWRLPTTAEWNALLAAFNSSYTALTPGGSSNFNAQLGGYRDNASNFTGMDVRGYYLTSSEEPDGTFDYVNVSCRSKSIATGASFPGSFALSMRLIKDA